MVNSPPHYRGGRIEVIDFIEDKKLNYQRGNVVKYVVRAGLKDPSKEVEDLRKCRWYVDRAIQVADRERALRNKASYFAKDHNIFLRMAADCLLAAMVEVRYSY